MSNQFKFYTYRVLRFTEIETRLNEAYSRGWELHSFTDDDPDGAAPSVVFSWRNYARKWQTPFADDEEEKENDTN